MIENRSSRQNVAFAAIVECQRHRGALGKEQSFRDIDTTPPISFEPFELRFKRLHRKNVADISRFALTERTSAQFKLVIHEMYDGCHHLYLQELGLSVKQHLIA